MKDISFDKNFGKWFINDVLRAIKKFKLITENDIISVALSGGKDSTTLLYILAYLKKYSDLSFSFTAAHIRIADYDTSKLRDYCRSLDVEYYENKLSSENEIRLKLLYLLASEKRSFICTADQERNIQGRLWAPCHGRCRDLSYEYHGKQEACYAYSESSNS